MFLAFVVVAVAVVAAGVQQWTPVGATRMRQRDYMRQPK